MGIGRDIRQKKFEHGYHKAMLNIMYTYHWIRDRHAALFREHGLLPQQYNVLRILKGQDPEPVSPGEIREVMLDKGVDLTRLVDKLVAMDLVYRCTCAENRRRVDITLTPAGHNLLNTIKPRMEALWSDFTNLLSEEEAETLSLLLDKFRGAKEES